MRVLLCALLIAGFASNANAAFEVVLDFSPGGQPPIDSSATGLPGDTYDVDLYLIQSGSDSLSAYGFSVSWDSAKIDLTGTPTNNPLPGGFIAGGDPDNGLFTGFTLGGTLADGTYLISTLQFTGTGIGLNETTNIDVVYDPVGNPQHGFARGLPPANVPGGDLTFTGGSISTVPEPGSLAALLAIGGVIGFRRRRAA